MEAIHSQPPDASLCGPAKHASTNGFAAIIGKSERLTQVISKARVLAEVDTATLLYGETGVGKELFARALHTHGRNRNAPFVALNCGGLPRDLLASELFGYEEGAFTGARRSGMVGKIEAAHGGTLFLDEIAELPLDVQPYLLRALEGGEVYPLGSNKPRQVRFRLISACNRDLRRDVGTQRFRMDLFYRISVTSLHIPPLRERREDLPALVAHFAAAVVHRHGRPPKCFAPEVFEVFKQYAWPGNLRELRNVVEAMVLMSKGNTVDLTTLPTELLAPAPAPCAATSSQTRQLGPLCEAERNTIATAIRMHAGNLTLVARDLRISRSTLYIRLKKYGLERELDQARAA